MKSKSELRKELLAARSELNAQDRSDAGEQIARTLESLPEFRRAKLVHCYLSMDDEVPTQALVEHMLKSGKTVTVPVLKEAGGKEQIVASEIESPDEPFVKNFFGVDEPETLRPVPTDSHDLFLVPGLGFDRRGKRLGFGKGFYDFFLKDTPGLKFGLAFSQQVLEEIPTTDEDIAMDFVITPTAVHARNQPPGASLLPQERLKLLTIARNTLDAYLTSATRIRVEPTEDWLAEKRGAFVTLQVRGNLRGCIGYVLPAESLAQTVAHCTVAAASEDLRFPPIEKNELPRLRIEISVLSVPRTVEDAQDIRLGRDGLIVGLGTQRGLLLPQVALEHDMDKETFLAHTCIKAGLSPEEWKDPEVEIQTFTAQVFSE